MKFYKYEFSTLDQPFWEACKALYPSKEANERYFCGKIPARYVKSDPMLVGFYESQEELARVEAMSDSEQDEYIRKFLPDWALDQLEDWKK